MSRTICFLMFLILGTGFLCAQNTYRCQGIVTDTKDNSPLVGASVVIKESGTGVFSNENGRFELELPKSATTTLVVSCVGYDNKLLDVSCYDNNDVYHISLQKSTQLIDEVVVTGTGTSHMLKNVPVRTEYISGKTIEELGTPNIEEALTLMNPSFSFAPNSMGSFLKVNGLGNDYILVLVNGKRMYGDVGGNNDLNRIPISNIKQVEIVKGASSSLYGSEAIAGVINIITKDPVDGLSASNDSYISAYGQFRQNNSVSYSKPTWSTSTNMSYKKSDGWQLSPLGKPSRSQIRKGQKDPVPTLAKASNAFEDRAISQEFTFTPNKKTFIRANGSIYDKEIKFPVDYKSYNYYYSDMNFSLDGKYEFSDHAQVNASAYYDNYKYKYLYGQKYNIVYNDDLGSHQKTFYDGDQQLNSVQELLNFKANGVFKIGEYNCVNTGVEYMNETLESPYRFKNDREEAYTASIYAQDEFSLKYLTLVAGLRWVNHEAFGSMLTPKISAMVGNDWLKFRTSYGEGFKAPTLKELYIYYEKEGMGSHYLYLGNPDLKPQTSRYVDASLEFSFEKLNFSVSAYKNKLKNMIAYKLIPVPDDAADRGVAKAKKQYNIEEASTEGVDVSLNWTICPSLQFNAGYSYVDAKDEKTQKVLDGVSKHQATTQLAWSHKFKVHDLRLAIQGKGQSERFYGKEEVEGNMLWEFTSNHSFTVNKLKFNINWGVDNIFDYKDDKPYGYHYSTLNPGRTLFAGLQIYFN